MTKTQLASIECPVCKNNFIPAPFHCYKVLGRRVCSWHCVLDGEREIARKRLDRRKKK